MKKSDLSRRALNYTRSVDNLNSQSDGTTDDVAYAWEAGYRAARADLRREVTETIQGSRGPIRVININGLADRVEKWLRPIR